MQQTEGDGASVIVGSRKAPTLTLTLALLLSHAFVIDCIVRPDYPSITAVAPSAA